jgi:diacylglycerol kinase family enzyme
MQIKYGVLINLNANSGRAASRWDNIAATVAEVLPKDTRFIPFRPPDDMAPLVQGLLQEGFLRFISAGGDGSANYLLNLLLQHTGENAKHLMIGGIGLGSSNDFIKPKQHFINGLPIRLDAAQAMLVDVGKAEFLTDNSGWQTRYFIANASLGVTAEANWFFNHGDRFLRFFNNKWTDLAIIYAALRTILRFRNFPATLIFEDKILETHLSNLAILKSSYVSGSFHFDDPVQRDDGFLGINACLEMSKWALVGTLIGLAKGRFRGRPQTLSKAAKMLTVRMPYPVALEMDGEVFQTSEVRFSVLPSAIQLMGL